MEGYFLFLTKISFRLIVWKMKQGKVLMQLKIIGWTPEKSRASLGCPCEGVYCLVVFRKHFFYLFFKPLSFHVYHLNTRTTPLLSGQYQLLGTLLKRLHFIETGAITKAKQQSCKKISLRKQKLYVIKCDSTFHVILSYMFFFFLKLTISRFKLVLAGKYNQASQNVT